MRPVPALLLPAAFLAASLLLAHHEMILTGFAFTQNDLGDTRFNHYVLEHGYRWLTGWPAHASLWSPPFFHPQQGTLAYSDNLLGALPFYAPWRLLGVRPDTSLQLWILTLTSLNFLAAFALLRGPFRLRPLASAVGAALFAAGAVRVNQTMHFQLFPHFFSLLAVHALIRLFEAAPDQTARRRRGWIALFAFAVTGQIYAAIYLGWFLVLTLTIAGAAALLVPRYRRPLLDLLRSEPRVIAAAAGLSALALAPLLLPYLKVADELGMRAFDEVRAMIPPPQAWLHLGPASWIYGPFATWAPFRRMPMEHELRLGFGLLTTLLCLVGLFLARRRPAVLLVAAVFAALLVLSTAFGPVTAWSAIYGGFPGAKAIRAVSRIGILFLFPLGLGVAVLLDRLAARGRAFTAAAAGLGLLCLLEQGQTTPSFSQRQNREDVAAIAARIDPAVCEAFLFSRTGAATPLWKDQLDAMMAQFETGVPTLNGYSGRDPPYWELGDTQLQAPSREPRVREAMAGWAARHRMDAAKICWIRLP